MKISTEEINSRLTEIFPGMPSWLPSDTEYLIIEEGPARILLDKYRDPKDIYIPNLWACEEIAMAFVVDVRLFRRDTVTFIQPEERLNFAIGRAFGLKFNGVNKYHTTNFFVSKDGIYLMDVQANKIWRVTEGEDELYFADM